MLPRVRINYASGAIGAVNASIDGVCGLIINGDPVIDKLELNKAYVLTSVSSLTALGVSESVNPEIYKVVGEFYAEGGDGALLWLMVVARSTAWTDMVSVNEVFAKALLRAAQGEIKTLGVVYAPGDGYVPVIANGVNQELTQVIVNAQALGEWATEEMYAPICTVVEAHSFDGDVTALSDLTDGSNNRVGVLVGDTTMGSSNAAIGVLLGRIAAIPVHHNVGRVKDGALLPLTFYVGNVEAGAFDLADLLYQKGYMSFRSYVGKAGYYLTDDLLATMASDDYRSMANRRVADKAYRTAYVTLIEELLDYVPVNTDGTIQITAAQNWQTKVVQAIASAMTASGELSADVTDASDRGVVCYVNRENNVLSTSTVGVAIKVRPFGYARYIDVELGFNVDSE